MNARSGIFNAINDERAFQDQKWGDLHNRPYDLGTWLLIMEAELQEAKHALLKEGIENTLQELLQTVTVGVAALEQHGVVTRWTKTNSPH